MSNVSLRVACMGLMSLSAGFRADISLIQETPVASLLLPFRCQVAKSPRTSCVGSDMDTDWGKWIRKAMQSGSQRAGPEGAVQRAVSLSPLIGAAALAIQEGAGCPCHCHKETCGCSDQSGGPLLLLHGTRNSNQMTSGIGSLWPPPVPKYSVQDSCLLAPCIPRRPRELPGRRAQAPPGAARAAWHLLHSGSWHSQVCPVVICPVLVSTSGC